MGKGAAVEPWPLDLSPPSRASGDGGEGSIDDALYRPAAHCRGLWGGGWGGL